MRPREIAAISSLATLGNAGPQLRIHIRAATTVGVSKAEIIEILMQTAVYAGFPAALNGLAAARKVFAAYEGRPAASQAIDRTTPPSTRKAAPVVAEACGEQT